MSTSGAIKELLSFLPRFAEEFINLVASPREYAATGKVFEPSRFQQALTFFGISLVITLVLTIPLRPHLQETFPYLAGDAIWKFTVVLIETSAIAAAWKLLLGRGSFGHYLVANFQYFGVLTVLAHLALLVGYAVEKQFSPPTSTLLLYGVVYFLLGGGILVWVLICWWTYGQFNGATTRQTIVALLITIALSMPCIFVGVLLRDTLLDSVMGK